MVPAIVPVLEDQLISTTRLPSMEVSMEPILCCCWVVKDWKALCKFRAGPLSFRFILLWSFGKHKELNVLFLPIPHLWRRILLHRVCERERDRENGRKEAGSEYKENRRSPYFSEDFLTVFGPHLYFTLAAVTSKGGADTRLIRGNDAYKINQDSISPHYSHLPAITCSATVGVNSPCHNKSACKSHESRFLCLLCIMGVNKKNSVS